MGHSETSTFEASAIGTSTAETWALVPVKRFSRAKTRLRGLLSADECARLAQTMLRDVLGHLAAADRLDGIAVVSADPEAFAIAKAFGAATIPDPVETGVNDAVQRGLDAFRSFHHRVLVVPADIPFAQAGDFQNVVELLDHTPVVLAPALSDGGTNALAMRSPGLLQPQFGEESFAAHRDLARKHRLVCSVLKSDAIGRDIDCPDDFGPCLKSLRDAGLTGSLLDEFNIAARLRASHAPAPLRLS
jgi:2-phospho-L-lactate/phosphoenolpyruvate guanylyltransferase